MWSRTSQQREIFTKLSHLPSSQRICSSLLTRMARVLVQSVKEAGAPHAGWYCCPGGEYCAVTPS